MLRHPVVCTQGERQTLNSLVIPEDFQRSLHGFVIPDRRLPVAKAMRLQISRAQNIPHRRLMDAVYVLQRARGLSQAPLRPMRHLPADRGRRLTGQRFNRLAFVWGKKRGGDLNAGHHTEHAQDRPYSIVF